MATEQFTLSFEELAYLFAQFDLVEQSRALLITSEPTPSRDVVDAQLRAAGHSLLARGWLTVNDAGETIVVEPLAHVVGIVGRAPQSIRIDMSTPTAEYRIAIHRYQQHLVRHTVIIGVVHVLELLESLEEVVATALDFFRVNEATPFTLPTYTIPIETFNTVVNAPSPEVIRSSLQSIGMAQEWIEALATDVSATRFRGTITLIEYDAERGAFADHGALLLRGSHRLWFLPIADTDGQTMATISAGDTETFRQFFQTLMS